MALIVVFSFAVFGWMTKRSYVIEEMVGIQRQTINNRRCDGTEIEEQETDGKGIFFATKHHTDRSGQELGARQK